MPKGSNGFKPGQSGNPKGKPPGPNRQTQQIKQAYLDLVNNNMDSIQGWLNSVAAKDPGKAIELLLKISPFVVPKLTEELGNVTPPVFILPAGVEAPKPQEDESDS